MLSLTQFAEILALLPARVEAAEHRALEQVGVLVEQTARDMLGHDQPGWADLADYTIAEKERLGLPSPSPLLRTGEHIRDTIHHHVSGHTVEIGSDSQVAKWQEEGTSRMPPRPFLKTAAVRDEAAIGKLIGENVLKALNTR